MKKPEEAKELFRKINGISKKQMNPPEFVIDGPEVAQGVNAQNYNDVDVKTVEGLSNYPLKAFDVGS